MITIFIVCSLLIHFFLKDDNSCQIDDDCRTDSEGDCVNRPKSRTLVYDHPGCICEDHKCIEAPCEPPCMLG